MSAEAEKRAVAQKTLAADSLAVGVVAVLAVTILQRAIGFTRNLLLCRYLDDTELGRWSLAFSSLLLLAPLIVLGLPGTFGRYVEAFRQRGQLGTFLRQTGSVCLATVLGASFLLIVFRREMSFLLFHDTQYQRLVVTVALALIVVAAANYVTELLMALRLGRLLSVLQLGNSLTFAAVSLVGVIWWQAGAEAVVVGYALGSSVVLVCGLYLLWRHGRTLFEGSPRRPRRKLWRALVPFAGWMWVTNLVANLYESVDRLMMVHLAPAGAHPEAMVGQYHAAQVVPLMIAAVAGMLSGIVLPYLSADWEEGNRDRLARRMNQTLQWSSLGLTAAGVGVLALRGWLFDWLLQGKYDEGLAVLPWTLAYSVWFGLVLLVQNYLWCAERAGRIAGALVLGLVVNVLANAWCIPRWGVQGAVLATSASVVTCLAVSCWLSARSGLQWQSPSGWICLLPAGLLAGPLVSGMLILLAAWCLHRRGLLEEWGAVLRRLRRPA